MSKKTVIYLIIGVLAIGFLLVKYIEYKEKSLDELFTNVKSFSFESHNDDDRWTTDKREAIDELKMFLSQYQVKKMKDPKGIVYSAEAVLWMNIHTKNKTLMVFFDKDRIHLPGIGYYNVLNGPIDKGWLQSFSEKYVDEN
ncbi:hypothetical protein M3193_04060 [Sporosarcina luteola]|uniref:hypothetical protein n=1 Tax=Sporosarcina luteola TaxID=582850 RepID=UPI00203E4AB1|nr:hypothetical protein [Sporosarcina luteola]MCM3743305.1 hypothetical protein [Sporosarcina luteola]